MDWQGWLTLLVVVASLAAMVAELAPPHLLLMAALAALAGFGILTPEETFAGFSNEALATVAALFVVAAALRESGALERSFARIFGRARTEGSGRARITLAVAPLSAVLNNTPIVAMMTPVVIDWARRNRLSPSRFLLPLDYATILGGVVTLIGTSTNLVVAGLALQAGMTPVGFFEIAWAGLPVCAVGLLYLLFVAPRFLPLRKEPVEELGERRREYTVAMLVQPDCPLVSQSVEDAGLRQLPGLFLVEIDRDGRFLTPVAPDEVILAGDRLVFAGVVSTIVDLQKIRGLVPAPEREDPVAAAAGRRLVEAVVSASSPLVNRRVRDADFRSIYDAVVIAVHRNGERVSGKIGEIVLQPGDTLLLQTAPHFLRVHGNSSDFYLVSGIEGDEVRRHERAPVAAAVGLLMVGLAMFEVIPVSIAALLAAGALVGLRCISGTAALRSIEWPVLLAIGAGFGIARAMAKTGAAEAVARLMVGGAGDLGPIGALAAIFLVTVVLTEILTNNAAAALMFPIAVATATQLGAEPRGFVMGVMLAASCGFASPVGYQTHLIVYGPGGYRFADFLRVGLPLDLLCAAVAIAVIVQVWPL
jgi:di/tricarboxylate transporter